MKKLLSFVLTLCLMLSVSVIFAGAEQSKEYFFIEGDPEVVGSVTYGFENPEGWEEVYAYAYCDSENWCGETENAPYPGVKLEKHFVKGYGEIYTYTYPSGLYGDLIFNNGTLEEPHIDVYKDEIFSLLNIQEDYISEIEYEYDEIYEHYNDANNDGVPDYVMVRILSNTVSPILVIDILGDYVLYGYNAYYPFDYAYGIYLPKENKVLSLEAAYYEGIEGIETALDKCPDARLIGDATRDGKITIKDATMIQKITAKMVNPYLDDLSDWNNEGKLPIGFTTDFNRDGKRNIQDATAIQKYLAKVHTENKELSETIEYLEGLDPKFFADDSIIVSVNSTEYNDYALYDFPEYGFRKIEKIGGGYDENRPATYALYLITPGHDNVIEAVKALWHRLDKDLTSIDINSIAYPD